MSDTGSFTGQVAPKLEEIKKCLQEAKYIASLWPRDETDDRRTRCPVEPQSLLKAIDAGLWWCDHDWEDAEKLWKAEADQ